MSACIRDCGEAEEESGELMGNDRRTESPRICFTLNGLDLKSCDDKRKVGGRKKRLKDKKTSNGAFDLTVNRKVLLLCF